LTQNQILTSKEVSQLLRIPLSTVYELAKRGVIRGVKFGKHWRFLEEDILRYFSGTGFVLPEVVQE
jgi:excisionase family DNA binding protein